MSLLVDLVNDTQWYSGLCLQQTPIRKIQEKEKTPLITKRVCWSKESSASNMKVYSQHGCGKISDSRQLQEPDD